MATIKQLRELENSEVENGKTAYQLDFNIEAEGVEDQLFMQNVYLHKKTSEDEAQEYVDQYEADYKADREAEKKAAEEAPTE